APNDCVALPVRSVCPSYSSWGETFKHWCCHQHSSVTSCEHARHHDHVTEGGDAGRRDACSLGCLSLTCHVKQHAAVDIIRHESWLALRHPFGVRHQRHFGEDLCG